jgi:hypothetical protein|tara:strand:- start:438 stop:644 length:207 start_codon:yes stop_codon:yes gene_type:complete
MEDDDPLITAPEANRLFCSPGLLRWARERDLDFKKFVREGIRASELRALGEHAMVDRILEARMKNNGL